MSFQGQFPPTSRPRKVEGGLKANSSRGAIGESWWSKRFLAVLESFALGTRLTRGRSYARAGQVISLDVVAGVVSSSVQGSRPKPYQVRIAFPALSEKVWAKLEIALADQALHSATLLSGHVPPEFEQVVQDCGAALFPSNIGQLTLSCNCPDSAVPCKHLAATFYLLAESFDADPFLLLAWRGRDRRALLDRLRTLRGGETAVPSDPARKQANKSKSQPGLPDREPEVLRASSGAALALSGLNVSPGEMNWDEFYSGPVPLPERPAILATEVDLLLRQLPAPGPELGGPALVDYLRSMYQRLAGGDS